MDTKILKKVNRTDGKPKIEGVEKYIEDYFFEDIWFAKVYRSKIQRGKIKKIHLPQFPENYYIIDYKMIPGKNIWHQILDDQKFLAEDVVNYIGEPILIVTGPDLFVVDEILSKIEVEYEPIEPINSIHEALSGEKPPIYKNDNIFSHYHYYKGDINSLDSEKNLLILEDNYFTSLQEHVYLETQGFFAYPENKGITVIGSMQCPYYVHKALYPMLDLPPERVRVIQSTTGGAFGGKEEFPSLIAAHAALAAYVTQRHVRVIYDREEDINVTTKRHPSEIYHKTYIDKNGYIKGMLVDIKLDGGAYSGLSPVVLARSAIAGCGIYNSPIHDVDAKVVATNNIVTGAYRGFGAPQAFFAVEMQINHICKKFGFDPIEFRKKNVLKQGEVNATGGIMKDPIYIPVMLDKVEKMSDFSKKYKEYEQHNKIIFDKVANFKIDDFENIKTKGIGISAIFHGAGFTGRGEEDIKATAGLKRLKDGKVKALVSTVEMGQGMITAFKKIVSAALDIDLDDVVVDNPDTAIVPDSGPTVASRTTMIVGGLLKKAADQMLRTGEDEVILTYKSPPEVKWDDKKFIGDAYPAYSWQVLVAEVEGNPITYEYKVTNFYTVVEVGKTIDEALSRVQVTGGLVQAMGYATMEKMEIKDGKILQKNLTDYIIPTTVDVPDFKVEFIDNPYWDGPYGAKGLGEMPFVVAPPAILSALEQAFDVYLYKIPATPEYIFEMKNNQKRG